MPYSEPGWQESAAASAWQALSSLYERAMRGYYRWVRFLRRVKDRTFHYPRLAFGCISCESPDLALHIELSDAIPAVRCT